MKLLSLSMLFAIIFCSSCIELDVQNPGGSASSTGSANGSSSTGGQGGQGGGTGGTAGTDVTSGSGASGGGGAPFCDPSDTTLIACYQFEGNTKDASQYNNPSMPTNVKFDAGYEGQAASFDSTARVAIANTSNWTISQYTVELWYYQRSYPVGRMGLFDSDNRLGMFVYGQGELRCTRSPDMYANFAGMPLNQWNHVACVFDGATLNMYINGVLKSTVMAPAISGGAAGAIGANSPSGDEFDGLIDNLRVWSVPHSAAEICISAGQNGC